MARWYIVHDVASLLEFQLSVLVGINILSKARQSQWFVPIVAQSLANQHHVKAGTSTILSPSRKLKMIELCVGKVSGPMD